MCTGDEIKIEDLPASVREKGEEKAITIPIGMTLEEAEGFARGWFEETDGIRGGNDAVRDKLIMRSCKSAVKANDSLSELEINDLMRRLAGCANPFSCPHGRPTFIKVTSYDIERSFRRK